MIRTPNPDRMKLRLVLAFIAITLLQTAAQCAEDVHHYVIDKPTSVVVGQDCRITITAHREDGSIIQTSRNRFKFYMSSSRGLETKDLQMKGGEADINLNFKSPENIILQVVDKSNPDVNTSDLMQVKVALPTKRGNQ